MMDSDMHPVIKAAALSFTFVYLHPFKDGNGRMHRFLIHHILTKTGFTPHGQIFPVSQVMRDDIHKYQQVLNVISSPLMNLIHYTQDSVGHLTVLNQTRDYYCYMDLTAAAEFLFELIERTLNHDFIRALNYLSFYDQAHKEIIGILDGLSEKNVMRFIQFCIQNNMRLSADKREKFFSTLTDEEVERMQHAVSKAFESS
jgi:hypothetical protein